MCPVTLILSVDPSIGRVEKTSLSRQVLMELVINRFTTKGTIIGDADDPDCSCDIGSWRGLNFDEKMHLISADFSESGHSGHVDLEWIPETLLEFNAERNELFGTLNLTELPQEMKVMRLASNHFSGVISLEKLPDTLEWLDVSVNQLTGSVCLENLPTALSRLLLNSNKFFGRVNLTRLPPTLRELHLELNQFYGQIDLTQLPSTLSELFLQHNHFDGETDFSKIPDTLCELDIAYTNLSGYIFQGMSKHFHVWSSNVRIGRECDGASCRYDLYAPSTKSE